MQKALEAAQALVDDAQKAAKDAHVRAKATSIAYGAEVVVHEVVFCVIHCRAID